MQRFILFLYFGLAILIAGAQTTITIGTGSESQPKPFDIWYGYARSASIYTAAEIGASGFITSLGWEVLSGDPEACPVKIYLKQVTDATLYATTWSNLTNGATLVYAAPVSFQNTGWTTLDVADYALLPGKNLLVLCEANYGGNGAPSNPTFAYSYYPSQHEGWQQHDSPPTDNGIPDEKRPNIQVTYVALSQPHPPSGFMAVPSGSSQVTLNWVKNSASNNVMVAFSTDNQFGLPSGTYLPGSSIAGGGTVIYNGSGSSFVHNSGLLPATTYHYRAWSVLPPNPQYSAETGAAATTLCETIAVFPYLTDFETPTFPPTCWSLNYKPWLYSPGNSAFGNGNGSAYADFYNIPAGNYFDLVSPVFNLALVPGAVLTFDHAYATVTGEVDRLELWVSYDQGNSYSLEYTWLGGLSGPLNTGGAVGTGVFVPTAAEWAKKSYLLPAGLNRFILRAVSDYGNELYLDNILISEPAAEWNGNVSGEWNNALNWTPAGVPAGSQAIVVPSGRPYNPVISIPGASGKNITVQQGATLLIQPDGTLTVNGDLRLEQGATLSNQGTMDIKGNLINLNTSR